MGSVQVDDESAGPRFGAAGELVLAETGGRTEAA
jgi:hypothetical protein